MYLLVCYSLCEGMWVMFNGDCGWIEYYEFIGLYMNCVVCLKDFKLEIKFGFEVEGEWIKVFFYF